MNVKELVADREERNQHVISIKEETELVLNDTCGLLGCELCFMCERSELCGCENQNAYGKNVSIKSNGSFTLTRNVPDCTFKVRLHLLSPFPCLSQSLSNLHWWTEWVLNLICLSNGPVTIGTGVNFDGYFDRHWHGDGTCKNRFLGGTLIITICSL